MQYSTQKPNQYVNPQITVLIVYLRYELFYNIILIYYNLVPKQPLTDKVSLRLSGVK